MARPLQYNVVCRATGKIHGAYATLRAAEWVAGSGNFRIESRKATQPKIVSKSANIGKRTVFKG